MCQLKSCLVLKDRVFCPDYNSHQQMLKRLGIEDNYLHASKTFVRVELLPPNTNTRSLREPLDRWTLRVDQDITPEWWDVDADRQRVEEAVEAWRVGHVFTEGKHIVTAGEVYAFGKTTVEISSNAKVKAYDNATVIARSNATVEAHDSAMVNACGRATVIAYNSAAVRACDSAKVIACGNATVEVYNNVTAEAYDNAVVKAYDDATVEVYGVAKVEIYNNVTAEAYDNAKVSAYDSTRVKTWSYATVKAYDNSIVIYPAQNKAIYPIGWTIETHE